MRFFAGNKSLYDNRGVLNIFSHRGLPACGAARRHEEKQNFFLTTNCTFFYPPVAWHEIKPKPITVDFIALGQYHSPQEGVQTAGARLLAVEAVWRAVLIAIKLRIEYPITNTEYPISNKEYPTSNKEYPTSKWNSLEL
jgi:hypothetical protein